MTHDVSAMIRAPISELQPVSPVTVEAGSPVSDAIALMQRHRIGCILVTAQGRLVGILSERDVTMKIVGREVDLDRLVDEFMTPDPEVLSPSHAIAFALNRMSLGGYRHVPLVESDGTPQGIISVKDVVDHIVEHFQKEVYNLPPEPDVHGKSREGA